MRVVLDTNVIISGLNFHGNERRVLALARQRRFELFLSPFILGEAAIVLPREFAWGTSRIEEALADLRKSATMVEPPPLAEAVTTSMEDDRVLACAVMVSADYLVTGDRDLLRITAYRGTSMITVRTLLSLLDETD